MQRNGMWVEVVVDTGGRGLSAVLLAVARQGQPRVWRPVDKRPH